jgi:hypothetical protein
MNSEACKVDSGKVTKEEEKENKAISMTVSNCALNEFTCNNGNCIPLSYRYKILVSRPGIAKLGSFWLSMLLVRTPSGYIST